MIYNLPRETKIEAPENYVLFSSVDPFTISATPGWDGKMIYSTDGETWKKWDGSEINTADTATANVIGFAGIDNMTVTGESGSKWAITGGAVSASGNIESLLDHKTVAAGKHPAMGEQCFSYIFKGCTGLTTAPALPATTLANWCYADMFSGCTALTTAPALPATTLAHSCYNSMFNGCTALTTAPRLPARTLADWCYTYMFYGCTSLKTVPTLPATTLIYQCYGSMFYGCTKIAIYSTTDTNRSEYRIPESGTGTTATSAMADMFKGTGGAMTGTPEINTTYYTANEIVGGTNKITTTNVGNYFTVTNGSYYFAGSYSAATGYTFTSNNNGVNSSTATTTLTALKTMFVSFGYSYSSEANYDKFTLKIGDATVEDGVSGSLTQKTWSGTVKKGEVISFTYAKDSSQNKNDDQCKFCGMTVKTVSTFTINSITYSFEDGMTWQDWVNSDYNADGYQVGGCSSYSGDDLVISSDKLYVVKTVNGNQEQTATGNPQDGAEYYED